VIDKPFESGSQLSGENNSEILIFYVNTILSQAKFVSCS